MSYNFISSEEELKKFYDTVLPDLKEDEVYFLSLAARKKYMRDTDQVVWKGSSEMFERRLVSKKDWKLFLSTIKKYEASEGAYIDSEGNNLPNHAMVVYLNTNPHNVRKAYVEYMSEITNNVSQFILNQGSSIDFFKNLRSYYMTALHHARGTKVYCELDIDLHKGVDKATDERVKRFINTLHSILTKNSIKYCTIETRGGFHVLLKSDTIHQDYMKLVASIALEDNEVIKEISNNTQGMLPCPGCLQAGFPVKIIDSTL